MSVGRDEVARIAALARLRLDPAEVDRLTRDMNRILEHATRLRKVAHTGRDVSPTTGSPAPAPGADADASTSTSSPGGTRGADGDVPDELATKPEAFAPHMVDGFFVVPPPPGVVPTRATGEVGGDA